MADIRIKKAKIVSTEYSDIVILVTESLPKPRDTSSEDTLSVVFTTKPGEGNKYVQDNFPGVESEDDFLANLDDEEEGEEEGEA